MRREFVELCGSAVEGGGVCFGVCMSGMQVMCMCAVCKLLMFDYRCGESNVAHRGAQ